MSLTRQRPLPLFLALSLVLCLVELAIVHSRTFTRSPELISLGVDTSPEAGWLHNQGLRIVGGQHRLELRWPDLASFPDYGLVRPRTDFDDVLARGC